MNPAASHLTFPPWFPPHRSEGAAAEGKDLDGFNICPMLELETQIEKWFTPRVGQVSGDLQAHKSRVTLVCTTGARLDNRLLLLERADHRVNRARRLSSTLQL